METVESVTKWANETFGEASISAQFLKAKEEFKELDEVLRHPATFAVVAAEAADVVICLYRIIGTLNPNAIEEKMAINRARQWKLDGKGCAQHVEN